MQHSFSVQLSSQSSSTQLSSSHLTPPPPPAPCCQSFISSSYATGQPNYVEALLETVWAGTTGQPLLALQRPSPGRTSGRPSPPSRRPRARTIDRSRLLHGDQAQGETSGRLCLPPGDQVQAGHLVNPRLLPGDLVQAGTSGRLCLTHRDQDRA